MTDITEAIVHGIATTRDMRFRLQETQEQLCEAKRECLSGPYVDKQAAEKLGNAISCLHAALIELGKADTILCNM